MDNSNSCPSDILRCPFIRNVNEPSNLSFTSSMPLPMPLRAAKGPIFEDGPNFEIAFRIFHGREGAVPLSGSSSMHSEKVGPDAAASRLNCLAAKAATISLSAFGPFNFDSFSQKWKKRK